MSISTIAGLTAEQTTAVETHCPAWCDGRRHPNTQAWFAQTGGGAFHTRVFLGEWSDDPDFPPDLLVSAGQFITASGHPAALTVTAQAQDLESAEAEEFAAAVRAAVDFLREQLSA